MNKIEQLYFRWLLDSVSTKEEQETYSMVFMDLYTTPFKSYDEFDDNLLYNSVELRDRFLDCSKVAKKLYISQDNNCLLFECSILEIMVYLAIEIEETIMTNNSYGDRTALWFWEMMDSLGLKSYDNLRYDYNEIADILENFILKRYKKNGKGGLFTVKSGNFDAKNMNIWQQAMHFLSVFAKKNGEIF